MLLTCPILKHIQVPLNVHILMASNTKLLMCSIIIPVVMIDDNNLKQEYAVFVECQVITIVST